MRKLLTILCAALLLASASSRVFAQPYNLPPHDPCDAPNYPVQSVLVNGNGNTTLLAAAPTAPALFGGGTAQVFLCGYQFASSSTFSFVTGTGATCGTGQTSLTGTMI